jgi:hypothetical protein
MAQDSTRRLLKVFGICVTECEDALEALEAAVAGGAATRAAIGPAVEAYGRAARSLDERWLEVARLLGEHQARAQRGVEAALRRG